MLGDIAPKLLSLLHTARLYQFDKKMRLQKKPIQIQLAKLLQKLIPESPNLHEEN